MHTVPGNDLAPEIKTFYLRELLENLKPNLVHEQFAKKVNLPKGSGKTVEMRRFKAFPKATTPLTEGVTPNGQNLDVGYVTAQISQYGDFVVLSDLLQMVAIDPIVVETTDALGAQAGVTLDTVVRNKMLEGTNVQFAPKVAADGTETTVSGREGLDATALLTVKLVQQVVRTLRRNNVPTINGEYVAIIHPDTAYDLMRNSEWIESHKYAQPENLYNGEIGKIGGVRFVETSEAKIYLGENLAGTTRNLAINNAAGYSAATTVAFDGGTVAADALIGRYVIINGTKAKVTDNTTTTLTLDTAVTCSDNAVIYPGEGAKEGVAAYASLFLGADAYAVTTLEGTGLQHFIKQLGSSGSLDPIDQRSSVGWKGNRATCILQDERIVRVEHCSSNSAATAGN